MNSNEIASKYNLETHPEKPRHVSLDQRNKQSRLEIVLPKSNSVFSKLSELTNITGDQSD